MWTRAKIRAIAERIIFSTERIIISGLKNDLQRIQRSVETNKSYAKSLVSVKNDDFLVLLDIGNPLEQNKVYYNGKNTVATTIKFKHYAIAGSILQ